MKKKAKKSSEQARLSDHFRELGLRLVVSIVVLAATSVAVYFFYEPLLNLLRAPLNAPLYYDNPAGSFALIMKVCLMGGLTISIPLIIYNLIMFIQPAFGESLAPKKVYFTTAFSAILAASGAAFAYYFILPGTLQFLSGFQVDGLSALISAENYLGFVTNIIVMFVIVFQLPLLIAFIDSVKRLPPKMLLKMEKWVILGSLIVALLAPFTYDFVTSLLIALPIVVLYNLSIIMVVFKHIGADRKAKRAKRAVALQPQFSPTPTLSAAFENQSDNYFTKPVQPAAHTEKRKPVFMDVKVSGIRPKVAQPIAPIATKPIASRPIYNGKVFSDIKRVSRPSHALAQ